MKIVLFDWNGTILDDIPIWYKSVSEIFRVFGKTPPTIAEYFKELEGDYIQIYRSRGIEASRDELNLIYEPFYQAHIVGATLFPNIKDVLRFLNDQGIITGIITAQKDILVSPLLDKFEIKDFFHYRVFHALDKKIVIQQILEQEKTNPTECYFIGDAPSDIRHGKKAGVVTIGFLAGYIPEELVVGAEPEYVIHNLEEIKSLF
ncbi:MAG: HAD family hydrolase [Patescibacteria group bacterium]